MLSICFRVKNLNALNCFRFEPFHSIVPRDISFQHELVLPYINEQIGQAMSSLYDCNMFSVPTTAFTKFVQMDQFNKGKMWCMDLLLFHNKLTFGDTYHAILSNWLVGHLPMVCPVTEYLQLCQDLDRRPSTISVIKHPDVGSNNNTLSTDYLHFTLPHPH
mgnify:CR=1 FL=1